MKKFFQNKSWQILGGLLGGIAGYFYWKEIGCVTGTCPITSKPLNSIIYFVTGTMARFRALKRGN